MLNIHGLHDEFLLLKPLNRDELEAALNVLGTRPTYAAQIARICYRLARVQTSLHDRDAARESEHRAATLMEKLSPGDEGRQLGEADVDGLLAFWSK